MWIYIKKFRLRNNLFKKQNTSTLLSYIKTLQYQEYTIHHSRAKHIRFAIRFPADNNRKFFFLKDVQAGFLTHFLSLLPTSPSQPYRPMTY